MLLSVSKGVEEHEVIHHEKLIIPRLGRAGVYCMSLERQECQQERQQKEGHEVNVRHHAPSLIVGSVVGVRVADWILAHRGERIILDGF